MSMFSLTRPLRRLAHAIRPSQRWIHIRGLQDPPSRPHDPLRILFCGADHFSIASLRAIWELAQADPEKVRSIDVVCRKDKRVGRGLKQIQAVPIKSAAQDLNLHLHQIDTFTGWQPPPSINLVVAVSFGLLVPARIIRGAKYGGLNVHPSLLPDLRGPAPIQHTILQGHTHTGVTLQTMHPTRFDHGEILAQTDPDAIPLSASTTAAELSARLSAIAAEVMRKSLERGIFVEPLRDLGPTSPDARSSHAPKITPHDRQIDWATWPAAEISRRDRAIGHLWDTATARQIMQTTKSARLTFAGPWTVLPSHETQQQQQQQQQAPGSPLLLPSDQGPRLGFRTADGQVIAPAAGTLEGGARGTGVALLLRTLEATTKRKNADGPSPGA
nr:methionyl-trna formyltransferase, mitochondrial [Quercus suber]